MRCRSPKRPAEAAAPTPTLAIPPLNSSIAALRPAQQASREQRRERDWLKTEGPSLAVMAVGHPPNARVYLQRTIIARPASAASQPRPKPAGSRVAYGCTGGGGPWLS